MTYEFKHTYEAYVSRCKTKPKVKLREYIKINALFMQFLMRKIFEGYQIQLPEKMGAVFIKGKKQKIRFDEQGKVIGLAPNWKATHELWKRDPQAGAEGKLIYHTNEHSDQVRYRFHWQKRNVAVLNKSFYSLRFSRANKRELARLIKGGTEYQADE